MGSRSLTPISQTVYSIKIIASGNWKLWRISKAYLNAMSFSHIVEIHKQLSARLHEAENLEQFYILRDHIEQLMDPTRVIKEIPRLHENILKQCVPMPSSLKASFESQRINLLMAFTEDPEASTSSEMFDHYRRAADMLLEKADRMAVLREC